MAMSRLLSIAGKIYDGEMTVFGGNAIAEPSAGRLRAAQIAAIFQYTPWMMLATVFNAIVLVATFSVGRLFPASLCWAGVVTAMSVHTLLGWRRNRHRATPATTSVRAIHSAIRRAAVFGFLWAILPMLFFEDAGGIGRLVIVCLCAGMLGGGAMALATVPAAALAYTCTIFAGVAIAFSLLIETINLPLLLLLLSYTAIILRVVIAHAVLFAEHLLARIESQSQLDVIGLLLCDFEENASDWLWETDAALRLTHVSPRLAALHGRAASDLAGLPFAEVLAPDCAASGPDGALAAQTLAEKFSTRQSFRQLTLPVTVAGQRKWWSLTAKVMQDESGQFNGFRGFGADVTLAREAQARIVELARYDSLTGLPNRLAFRDAMNAAISRLNRHGERFAVLCLDLDHFKLVNDTKGHHAGDALLAAVAKRLAAILRPMDTAARIGGDEFTIIHACTGQIDEVADLAQTIDDCLSQPYDIEGHRIEIGASVGIAMAPSDGIDAETLLKNADLALYRAKSAGRGGYCFFEPNMDADARARRLLERDLRTALALDQFRLHFQPVIDLVTNQVCAFEALLRWQCPVRGLVPPMQFISVIEETGMIDAVGDWVLHQACLEAKQWPAGVRVAVNVSALQFRNAGIVTSVRKALEASRLEPGRLEIEITESVFIADLGAAQAILLALRQMGVRIALDDFGTGFSSLSYLRRLSFDKIKLDKSFIDDVASDKDSASIVRALIDLAGELGMDITAEGVETQAQLDSLQQKGCGTAQGYLFSKPVEGSKVAELMAQLSAKMRMAA